MVYYHLARPNTTRMIRDGKPCCWNGVKELSLDPKPDSRCRASSTFALSSGFYFTVKLLTRAYYIRCVFAHRLAFTSLPATRAGSGMDILHLPYRSINDGSEIRLPGLLADSISNGFAKVLLDSIGECADLAG